MSSLFRASPQPDALKPSEIKTLIAFATDPVREWTNREMAQLIGLSESQTCAITRGLAESGYLERAWGVQNLGQRSKAYRSCSLNRLKRFPLGLVVRLRDGTVVRASSRRVSPSDVEVIKA